MTRRAYAGWLLLVIFARGLPAAVEGNEALYLGGTVPGIAEGKKGRLDTSDSSALAFLLPKYKWELPFKSITRIEYGEKVGRRVGAAIALTTVTWAGPLLLASKKKRHFLTLEFKDAEGSAGAAVFELSKVNYAEVIADLETKTGLKLEYQPAEEKGQKESKP